MRMSFLSAHNACLDKINHSTSAQTPHSNCGEGVMQGPGHLPVTESTTNSSAFQSILVKFEAICPTAKAWLKLGRATAQSPQTYQEIYNRMIEREKNEGVAMTEFGQKFLHKNMRDIFKLLLLKVVR